MDRLRYDYYYGLTLRVYAAIGQWPFLNTKQKIYRRFIIHIMLILYMFVNISAIITRKFDKDVIIADLPLLWSSFVTIPVLVTLYYNDDKCKRLFLHLQKDWYSFHTPWEVNLKLKYAESSSKFTYYSLVYISFLLLAVVFWAIVVVIYSKVVKGVEIDLCNFQVKVEVFLDCRKFGFPTLFFLWMAISTLIYVIVSNGVVAFLFLQHICGMFHVVSHRLEQAIAIFKHKEEFTEKEKISILRFVGDCAVKHRDALEFANDAESYYTIPIFLTFTGYVISLLVAVIQTMEELKIEAIIFLISIVVFASTLSLVAQHYTDMSTMIADKAYEGTWYDAPPCVQRLFILIMARSQKPNVLTAANLFDISVENLRSIFSTSMSYYMFYRNVSYV